MRRSSPSAACRRFLLTLGLLLGLASTDAVAGPWSELLRVPSRNVIIAGASGGAVHGFDARTGAPLWQRPAESPSEVRLILQGDAVLMLAQEGQRVAQVTHQDPTLMVERLNARTGASEWVYRTPGALRGQPVLAGDRLVFSVDLVSEPRGRLVSIDATSGAEAWAVAPAGRMVQRTGDELLVAEPAGDGHTEVASRPLTSGQARWKSPALDGAPQQAPTRVDDTVVVLARTAAPSDPAAEKAASRRAYGLSGVDGHIRYTLILPDSQCDHLQLCDGTLVARSSDDKTITAYDARTGAQRWRVSPPQAAGAKGTCAVPLVSNGIVYVAAAPSPERFTLLAYDATSGVERARRDVEGRLESPVRALPLGILLGVQSNGAATEHTLMRFSGDRLTPGWSTPLDAPLGESALSLVDGPRGPMVMLTSVSRLLGFTPTGEKFIDVAADIATDPIVYADKVAYGDNQMRFVLIDLRAPNEPIAQVTTKPWFNSERLPNLVFVVVIVALILTFIAHARRNSNLFIRRLPGLNALDDAVGRATEMGKPVLYVCGTQDVDEIETLAGLSILGHVARRAAEYETPLLVPTSRSVVMSTAQEVVREAHFKAGRPDSYQQDNIRYLTDDQFGFVAGVDGIMMRERPAANFYMGMFFGESLILAETGHATGAIQIAGTAQASQLPFFVAACDYTLMGEELFAASAYMSRDPREVGSLKGQDYAKAVIMAVIVVASLLCPWFPQVKTWLSQ